MSKKTKSAWDEFHSSSVKLRRSLAKLAADFHLLSTETAPTAIRGAAVATSEMSEWEQLVESLLPEMRQYTRAVEQERDRQTELFEQQLARELTQRGHSVHGETSPLIVDGIVYLETDLKRGVVKVNGASAIDLNSPTIIEMLDRELQQLRKLIIPPEKMIAQILQAYDAELRMSGRAPGAQVQTSAIHFHLTLQRQALGFRSNPTSANFKEYPTELFRADLYTLLTDGRTQAGEMHLRYASGSDINGAIFMMVPALGRTAHVGRIWFEKNSE